MKWVTILCLSAALGWTALLFVAYRDWDFAFQTSLIAWLFSAALWLAIRFGFGGRGKGMKAKSHNRNHRAIAGGVLVAALGILVFAVLTGQRAGKSNKSNKAGFFSPLKSTSEPSSKAQKPQSLRQDEPKGKAITGEIAQKTEGPWSVQVAAFRSESEAIRIMTNLKGRGYEAYVIRAEVNAVNLYRTKVGRFKTREEAEKLLTALKDKEAYTTAFVVRDLAT